MPWFFDRPHYEAVVAGLRGQSIDAELWTLYDGEGDGLPGVVIDGKVAVINTYHHGGQLHPSPWTLHRVTEGGSLGSEIETLVCATDAPAEVVVACIAERLGRDANPLIASLAIIKDAVAKLGEALEQHALLLTQPVVPPSAPPAAVEYTDESLQMLADRFKGHMAQISKFLSEGDLPLSVIVALLQDLCTFTVSAHARISKMEAGDV